MNKSDFLLQLDELLELPSGTLTGSSILEDNEWSSIAVVGFIALVDEQFGTAVPPAKIARCRTADDLIELLHEHIVCEV